MPENLLDLLDVSKSGLQKLEDSEDVRGVPRDFLFDGVCLSGLDRESDNDPINDEQEVSDRDDGDLQMSNL